MGPLSTLKIIEFAGLGPAPFAAMMLADMGADVIRIDRPGAKPNPHAVTARGRPVLTLDLKDPADVAICLELIGQADALIEGFRPGVMERLGLGPEVALARNPRLAYGRMTGWGQDGPYAAMAGHDINYIALSGALDAVGTAERPIPPLNLVGDFGGGAMYLAFGILAAVTHARATGQGQVVDAAMTDGSASLMAMMYGFRAAGAWKDERAANRLDGGAHFYDTYRCADGKFLAVGSIEPQFYALLLKLAGIDDPEFAEQADRERWPALKEKLAATIATRTRDAWAAIFDGTDACVAPVLSMAEAPAHPHNRARGTFITLDGVVQPGPAPRFSITPGEARAARLVTAGEALRNWAAG